MGIVQRYSSATQSSNLKDDEHHHATEVLAAIALSGSETGAWHASNMLLRVKYASDASSYPALLIAWRERVKAKAELRGWPVEVSPAKVARLSLDHWLTDVCPVCQGRGSLPHEGIVNVLSDDACPVCAGSAVRSVGLRPSMLAQYSTPVMCHWFPCVKPAHLVEYVQGMLDDLEMLTIRAGGAALRKLADEINDLG